MATSLLLVLALQQLDVSPRTGEVGAPVSVRAVDARQQPIAGLAVTVELPDGSQTDLGRTGADGSVAWSPAQTGAHCYRAVASGVVLLAPHHVVAPRRRWLYALACVPVGLALLWRHLRRRRTAPA